MDHCEEGREGDGLALRTKRIKPIMCVGATEFSDDANVGTGFFIAAEQVEHLCSSRVIHGLIVIGIDLMIEVAQCALPIVEIGTGNCPIEIAMPVIGINVNGDGEFLHSGFTIPLLFVAAKAVAVSEAIMAFYAVGINPDSLLKDGNCHGVFTGRGMYHAFFYQSIIRILSLSYGNAADQKQDG